MSEAWEYEPEPTTPAATGEVMFEQALIGAAMHSPRRVPDAADLAPASDFADPHRAAAWAACIELANTGKEINPQSVASMLAPLTLQALGGPLGLLRMSSIDVCPVPQQILTYAAKVRDLATRKRLRIAVSVITESLNEREDVAQAVEDARQAIDEAAGGLIVADGSVSAAEAMDETIDWMATEQRGSPTPWPDVNEKTNGLLAGQMITVAARPGHGKSLVAKDVALEAARSGKAVHIATLEMTRQEYMARILVGIARVEMTKMAQRRLDDREWALISKAAEEVRGLPIEFDDRTRQTMATIRASARTTARKHGPLGLIVIDYCQLVTATDRRQPREQQVADISRQTKLLAKEFACPVMLLAQLNRGNVGRPDKTPMVSDLRESGALEQDSDQVWLLHRPDQYGDERLGEVDLIVGKNRNGPAPSTVALSFQGHRAFIGSLGH